jgi:hypothetical protein
VSETDENTATEKSPEDMAYNAGYQLVDVKWPAAEIKSEDDPRDPDKLLTPGVHHNPFDLRVPEQRAEAEAWLRGLRDRIGEPTKSPDEILADVDAALGDSDA